MGDRTDSVEQSDEHLDTEAGTTTLTEGAEDAAAKPSPAGEAVDGGTPDPQERSDQSAPGPPADDAATPTQPRRPRDPALARAWRTRRPVRGNVARVIKGGFEVRVGKQRAFCPFSQMDLHRVADPDGFVGNNYYFRVIQFRRGGDDVVLSRRALLEEEQAEEAKAVRATLVRGSVMRGRVVGTSDFGAFVDLGAGVTGLVHLSELSHARVSRPTDAVSLGDQVSVKVLKIDESRGRVSLSMRQAEADPWDAVRDGFSVGEVYPGTVLRLEEFGAFVELAPGVEALVRARDLPPTDDWSAGLQPGREGQWRILSLETRRRRIDVVPADVAAMPEPSPGQTLTGKVQRVERYGVFVWLGPGSVGLIPGMLTGTPKGTDLSRRFAVGRDVQVDVVDIEEAGRRIRLAVHGVKPSEPVDPPRASRRVPGESAPRPDGGEFRNTLGDALKAALDKR